MFQYGPSVQEFAISFISDRDPFIGLQAPLMSVISKIFRWSFPVVSHSFFSHYPPFFVIRSLSPFSLCHRSWMIKFLQFLMWYFLVSWRCSFFCFSLCCLSSEALYSYLCDYHHREESSARLLEPGHGLKRASALNMGEQTSCRPVGPLTWSVWLWKRIPFKFP